MTQLQFKEKENKARWFIGATVSSKNRFQTVYAQTIDSSTIQSYQDVEVTLSGADTYFVVKAVSANYKSVLFFDDDYD